MTRRILRLLPLFALFAGIQLAGAKDLNIACVHMENVFDNYFKTLRFEQSFRNDADFNYLNNLEDEADRLERKFEELINASQSIALSEDAKKQKQQEAREMHLLLREKENDIRVMRRKILRRKEDERQKILVEISDLIEGYAKEQEIDLLVDISGRTMNRIPTVIYFEDSLDVTKELLSKLNAGHEDEVQKLLAGLEKQDADGDEAAPAEGEDAE